MGVEGLRGFSSKATKDDRVLGYTNGTASSGENIHLGYTETYGPLLVKDHITAPTHILGAPTWDPNLGNYSFQRLLWVPTQNSFLGKKEISDYEARSPFLKAHNWITVGIALNPKPKT